VGPQRNKGKGKKSKFIESSKDEDTIYQNLWDIAKVAPRGKFIAMCAYI
jgi:hypothetical protein